jgi:hypothetical protein
VVTSATVKSSIDLPKACLPNQQCNAVTNLAAKATSTGAIDPLAMHILLAVKDTVKLEVKNGTLLRLRESHFGTRKFRKTYAVMVMLLCTT